MNLTSNKRPYLVQCAREWTSVGAMKKEQANLYTCLDFMAFCTYFCECNWALTWLLNFSVSHLPHLQTGDNCVYVLSNITKQSAPGAHRIIIGKGCSLSYIKIAWLASTVVKDRKAKCSDRVSTHQAFCYCKILLKNKLKVEMCCCRKGLYPACCALFLSCRPLLSQ